MSKKIAEYLPFYLGCNTNKGKLLGMNQQVIFIQSALGNIIEEDIEKADFFIKPFLKKRHDLSNEESSKLIEKGINIGRPKGYSFSPDAFLYLLSLHVDLFNLIEKGLALDIAMVKTEPL